MYHKHLNDFKELFNGKEVKFRTGVETFNIKISEFAFEHYGFKNIENMADTVIYEMNRNENRIN